MLFSSHELQTIVQFLHRGVLSYMTLSHHYAIMITAPLGHEALHRATLASQGKPTAGAQNTSQPSAQAWLAADEEKMLARCTARESIASQAWIILQLGACHACPDVVTSKEDLVACSQCSLKYCTSCCLAHSASRNGDTPEAIKENPHWICYFCQGCCTCAQCKRSTRKRIQTRYGDESKQLVEQVQRLEERLGAQDKVLQAQQETIIMLLAKAQEYTEFRQRMEEFMALSGIENTSRKRPCPSELVVVTASKAVAMAVPDASSDTGSMQVFQVRQEGPGHAIPEID